MLNRLKGSRSSSRKGQGHWSFLPVVVKPIHLFVLNVVYGVWMECGIFLDGQGHGHAKVKVKGFFSLSVVATLMGLLRQIRIKRCWWSSESFARFKVKVMQVSRSYEVFDCSCYTYWHKCTKLELKGVGRVLKRLKGSRSRSHKGQGHWRFLPVVAKRIALCALYLVYRVWTEYGILWSGQGQRYTKVKGMEYFHCGCSSMGLFASTLENRVGIEWYIFFTGVKVEVIQRSRSLSSVINRDSRYLSVCICSSTLLHPVVWRLRSGVWRCTGSLLRWTGSYF